MESAINKFTMTFNERISRCDDSFNHLKWSQTEKDPQYYG